MAEATLTRRDPLTALLRRDRWIVLGGLGALTVFTAIESRWTGDAMMRGSDPAVAGGGPAELAAVALMWGVMMVAMMTPTASPMVLAFAGLERRRVGSTGAPWRTVGAFLGGYLLIWMGFSVMAALAQGGLHSAGALSACGMAIASPSVEAALLIGAGIFQFSTAKSACLKHCRTPTGFLLSEWRDGAGGALVMGLRHGLYCVGCCWLLMLLLFVVGVMNVVWCAALAVLVLAERIMPGGLWLTRAAGVALAAAGVLLAAGLW